MRTAVNDFIRRKYGMSLTEYDGIEEMTRTKIECDKTPTASIINGVFHVNRNWWTSLDTDQRIAVLRHEYKHLTYQNIPLGDHIIMTHDRLLSWFEPIKPKCECGAKHTSFPDIHSDWCPNWEKQ